MCAVYRWSYLKRASGEDVLPADHADHAERAMNCFSFLRDLRDLRAKVGVLDEANGMRLGKRLEREVKVLKAA